MDNQSMHESHNLQKSETNKIEYLKFIGVMIFIIISAFLLHINYGIAGYTDYLRWLMGVSFLIFGLFKIIGYKNFVAMFPMYDILAKKLNIYSYLYPFIELLLASLYLIDLFGIYKDFAALIITTIGSWGILKNILAEGKIKCACLGNIIKLPLSKVSLFENLSMAIMALVMIFY